MNTHTIVRSRLIGRCSSVHGATQTFGPADYHDIERGVVLVGKRYDLKEGERLTVRGKMRILEHCGAVVNGVIVPPWFEIRVEEVK